MMEKQKEALLESGKSAKWNATLDLVPHKPIILVAQEFFDALPVHQFNMTDS